MSAVPGHLPAADVASAFGLILYAQPAEMIPRVSDSAGCNAVIHLAAAKHETNVSDAYFELVDMEATRQLIEGGFNDPLTITAPSPDGQNIDRSDAPNGVDPVGLQALQSAHPRTWWLS